MLLIAAAFTGCTEDFKNWASPQSNGPEDAITIPGFTASAVAAQNLATAGDEVPTFSLNTASLPEGFELGNARIELTPMDIDDPLTTTVNTTLTGLASKEALQDLIIGIYGKRPTNRMFNGHVLVNAIKDGQAVFIDAGNIEVNLTPEAPYIFLYEGRIIHQEVIADKLCGSIIVTHHHVGIFAHDMNLLDSLLVELI